MKSRARRIQDKQRMKAKAKRIGQINGIPGNWDKLADHLAACSCFACGNPRRYFNEKTMQERRFFDCPPIERATS